MSKSIELYTWPYCPFCIRAKALLDDKGVDYTDHNIFMNGAEKKRLTDETGQSTVPYIFIDGELIGGFQEMASLDARGLLDDMIK
jgi:glutaredoxin 3